MRSFQRSFCFLVSTSSRIVNDFFLNELRGLHIKPPDHSSTFFGQLKMLFAFLSVLGQSAPGAGELRRIEQLMAFHQFWNAYSELNQIIQREKNLGFVENKLYRLRGTCCLHMAMTQEIIENSKAILSNDPNEDDKKYAYLLQARGKLQKGDYYGAEGAAKKSGDRQLASQINELQKIYTTAQTQLKNGQINEAAHNYDILLRNSPKAAKLSLQRADIAWLASDHGKFNELTKDIENEFPDDAKFLYRRGVYYLCNGELDKAIQRIKKSSALKDAPKNCSVVLNAISTVNKHYNNAEQSLKNNQPDNANESIKLVSDVAADFCPSGTVLSKEVGKLSFRLLKITATKEEILEKLNKIIDQNPDSNDMLLERADILLEQGDFDAALFDYSTVQRRNPGDRRASEGINKAQDLKKKSLYVDHYKILGLEKGASISEIKTAYRKLVRQWHPDRFGDKEKKKEAETMMKKINTAYDILSDPQKKQLYDSGQDPENPGMNSDFQNFNPFDIFSQFTGGQGGGQTFKFGGGQGFHFEFHF